MTDVRRRGCPVEMPFTLHPGSVSWGSYIERTCALLDITQTEFEEIFGEVEERIAQDPLGFPRDPTTGERTAAFKTPDGRSAAVRYGTVTCTDGTVTCNVTMILGVRRSRRSAA